ncbi:hypothetical protein [Halorientalis regularis]|uniref:Glutamyl-tRNAGlu reductase, dimerisation domain n=1 Tax=Halorientalis regularis TaxID=660518 RepID=A0A1G7R2R0_9EURY|nr:hypothetical protein [Halorientalis regularis]SDG05017.1 Glutamyl-tRNAGlu reductase, dimerisation domain [Halorientalis regularis]
MTGTAEADTVGEHPGDESTDIARAIERIDDRAATVRERQVERALAELETVGDPDPETRAAVRRLADRLTGRLVATPKAALRQGVDGSSSENETAAGPDPDAEAVRVALDLFGD